MQDTQNIDANTDSADPDVLRAIISTLREQRDAADDRVRIATIDLKDAERNLNMAEGLIRHLAQYSENEDQIREWADGDEDCIAYVRDLTGIDLDSDYAVTVTVPVSITVVVRAATEDGASDMVCDVLATDAHITVSGVDEFDYDFQNYIVDEVETIR